MEKQVVVYMDVGTGEIFGVALMSMAKKVKQNLDKEFPEKAFYSEVHLLAQDDSYFKAE